MDVVAPDDLVEADPVKWQDFGEILEGCPYGHYQLQPDGDLQYTMMNHTHKQIGLTPKPCTHTHTHTHQTHTLTHTHRDTHISHFYDTHILLTCTHARTHLVYVFGDEGDDCVAVVQFVELCLAEGVDQHEAGIGGDVT